MNLGFDHRIKGGLIEFLHKNLDVFAWKPKDMPKIDPKVITYKLNVHQCRKPMQQRKRKFSRKKNEVI